MKRKKWVVLTILVGLITVPALLAFTALAYWGKTYLPNQPVVYGVSFSPTYAKSLELDWRKIYIQMLDELGTRHLRLPTYWKDIEPQQGKFYFDDVDFMLEEAGQREAKVILVVGAKQPRWPECQPPKWALEFTLNQRQEETLKIIERVVVRYRNNPTVTAWQVENEPLYEFGLHCDPPDRHFLQKEVGLVRSLDATRPIIISDSGEWRFWVTPMQLSDIFGTTLYKMVYNNYLGYFTYPLPPSFYQIKSGVIRKLFAPHNKKTIIIELQSEPWSPKSLAETSIRQQLEVFDITDFKNNVEFAQKTGFDEIYLWGVEWWYFMAQREHGEFLEYAKSLMGDKSD